MRHRLRMRSIVGGIYGECSCGMFAGSVTAIRRRDYLRAAGHLGRRHAVHAQLARDDGFVL